MTAAINSSRRPRSGSRSTSSTGRDLGVLLGKNDLLRDLKVPRLRPAPDGVPERMETGTQSHEGMVGAAAAVDFLASLADGPTRRERLLAAMEMLHGRGDALVKRLWEGFAKIEGVRLYGSP